MIRHCFTLVLNTYLEDYPPWALKCVVIVKTKVSTIAWPPQDISHNNERQHETFNIRWFRNTVIIYPLWDIIIQTFPFSYALDTDMDTHTCINAHIRTHTFTFTRTWADRYAMQIIVFVFPCEEYLEYNCACVRINWFFSEAYKKAAWMFRYM